MTPNSLCYDEEVGTLRYDVKILSSNILGLVPGTD